MSEIEKELLDLKKMAQEATTKADQGKGRRSTYYEQLSEKYGFNSIADADKYIKKEEKEIEKLNDELEAGTEQLKNTMIKASKEMAEHD